MYQKGYKRGAVEQRGLYRRAVVNNLEELLGLMALPKAKKDLILRTANESFDEKLNKLPKCAFSEAWRGYCKNKPNESGYCDDHEGETCRECGKQATHDCAHTSQFVCGRPLCDDCRCNH